MHGVGQGGHITRYRLTPYLFGMGPALHGIWITTTYTGTGTAGQYHVTVDILIYIVYRSIYTSQLSGL